MCSNILQMKILGSEMLKNFNWILSMCLNFEHILISNYTGPLNVTVKKKVGGDKKPSLKHNNNLGMK